MLGQTQRFGLRAQGAGLGSLADDEQPGTQASGCELPHGIKQQAAALVGHKAAEEHKIEWAPRQLQIVEEVIGVGVGDDGGDLREVGGNGF